MTLCSLSGYHDLVAGQARPQCPMTRASVTAYDGLGEA